MGENDLKILKTEFPDNKWKVLGNKLAYPYECFNSLYVYQKPVDNITKEDFFSNLKNIYHDYNEIERTKGFSKLFNIKIGEELTRLYLKSDVFLLTCVFEKFIKVSINEFGIIFLYCASLLGYTWECGLRKTRVNLQTLQKKDMISLLEIIVRGGISSVMGDRYVKGGDNKKVLYIDAFNLYGWAMSESLLYDEIEMWLGHPDLYIKILEEI